MASDRIRLWCGRKATVSKLYGFVVKRIYNYDNIQDVVQTTFMRVLSMDLDIDDYEKFISYLCKTAQNVMYLSTLEDAGYIKPTMAKAHPETVKAFSSLYKDDKEEEFKALLERPDLNTDDYTSIAKIELEELAAKVLVDSRFPGKLTQQYKVFVRRLYGMTYSEIAKELGISSKSVGDSIRGTKVKLAKLLTQ